MPAKHPTIVVYDVGNVLVDWDPRYLYRKLFTDTAEMEWFLSEVCSPAWNLAQDGGRPWAEAEAEAIARHPNYAQQVKAYRARWHEMIKGLIPGAEQLLEDFARARVPLYAITNFAGDTFRETCARYPMFRHFDGIVVSGDIKLLKPDPEIYRRLTTTFGLDLETCVFIDDNQSNIDAARKLGMSTIRFKSTDDARARLISMGFPLKAARET